MKKLLVLALVLALVQLAGATTLTWSADSVNMAVNGTVTVQLIASDALNFSDKWVGADAGTIAEITGITTRAAAGGNAVVQNPGTTGYPGWWVVSSVDSAEPFTIAAGAQYDVAIKGLAIGSYVIGSDAYGSDDSLTINVIPEPATMALLSLGALLLRRKK